MNRKIDLRRLFTCRCGVAVKDSVMIQRPRVLNPLPRKRKKTTEKVMTPSPPISMSAMMTDCPNRVNVVPTSTDGEPRDAQGGGGREKGVDERDRPDLFEETGSERSSVPSRSTIR